MNKKYLVFIVSLILLGITSAYACKEITTETVAVMGMLQYVYVLIAVNMAFNIVAICITIAKLDTPSWK